jgi:hypothetical protein
MNVSEGWPMEGKKSAGYRRPDLIVVDRDVCAVDDKPAGRLK